MKAASEEQYVTAPEERYGSAPEERHLYSHRRTNSVIASVGAAYMGFNVVFAFD
jgi:hypothetical protein